MKMMRSPMRSLVLVITNLSQIYRNGRAVNLNLIFSTVFNSSMPSNPQNPHPFVFSRIAALRTRSASLRLIQDRSPQNPHTFVFSKRREEVATALAAKASRQGIQILDLGEMEVKGISGVAAHVFGAPI